MFGYCCYDDTPIGAPYHNDLLAPAFPLSKPTKEQQQALDALFNPSGIRAITEMSAAKLPARVVEASLKVLP